MVLMLVGETRILPTQAQRELKTPQTKRPLSSPCCSEVSDSEKREKRENVLETFWFCQFILT